MSEFQQVMPGFKVFLSVYGCIYGSAYFAAGFAGVLQYVNCPQMTKDDYFYAWMWAIGGIVVFSFGTMCLSLIANF